MTTSIAPNNGALLYSPANWNIGASVASSINAGAYFRTLFTGTSCVLNFNVSANASPYSEIWYRIDGEAGYTQASVAATIACVMPAATSAEPLHLLEVVVKSTSETLIRWGSGCQTAVSFIGLTIDSGASVMLPNRHPQTNWIFGDSITEGVRTINQTATNDTDRNDNMAEYSWNAMAALSCEFGIVGFGATGWCQVGSGGVPAFPQTWNYLQAGVPRSLSPSPSWIFINHGTNDSQQTTAAVVAAAYPVIFAMLAGTPSTTRIGLIRPFNGSQAAAIQQVVAAFASTGRVFYLDTTGLFLVANGADSFNLHPTSSNATGLLAPGLVSLVHAASAATARPPLYRSMY